MAAMLRVRPRFLSFESMPTYEYRCPNGHDSELFFRKISDAATETQCPVCGAQASRRVSGGAGLLFKGSGFYLTDYGKNAHRKASGDASTSDGKTEAKAETKSEGAKSSGTSDAGTSGSKPKSDAGKSTDTKPSSTKSSGGDAT